ncbi:MAG: hypothetical protein EKK42_15565 [Pseudonocardiaceae bacterium]|nr:MAG: hypothetical protein EKK42_15565 [Pseudonocardiaceae bacterium]
MAESGGSVGLLTLTIRHSRTDTLRDMWAALSAAWGAVTSGRGWVADQQVFGIRGWVRTTEYTHSPETGHHLHVHALVIFDGPTSPDMMGEMGSRAFGRWQRALGRNGFTAVEDRGGLDIRPVRLDADSIEQVAEYVSKAAFEVTSTSTKRGRNGSRSAFEILADAVQGEADSIELWWLWEAASLGKRQVTYSRGLREWARVGREESDEEIVSTDDLAGDDQVVLPAATWKAVRDRVTDLLDALEIGGIDAAVRWLRSRSLAYQLARHGADRPYALRHVRRERRGHGGRRRLTGSGSRPTSGSRAGSSGSSPVDRFPHRIRIQRISHSDADLFSRPASFRAPLNLLYRSFACNIGAWTTRSR